MQPSKGSNWQLLLKRWLSGRITAQEERELDRHALNDSFLSEALEGYRQHPEGDHQQQLERLKSRFYKEDKRQGFYFWRIAAAIAVLIFAGRALWQINLQKERDTAFRGTAMEERSPQDTVAENHLSIVLEKIEQEPSNVNKQKTDSATALNPTNLPTSRVSNKSVPTTAKAASPPHTEATAGATPPSTAEEYILPSPALSEVIIADQMKSAKKPTEDQAPSVWTEEEKELPPVITPKSSTLLENSPSPLVDVNPEEVYTVQTEVVSRRRKNQEVIGKITNREGNPVPGVTIHIPGTTTSVVSDIFGQFVLTLPLSYERIQLTYYDQSKMITVGSQDSFLINPDIKGQYLTLAKKEMPRTGAFKPAIMDNRKSSVQSPRPAIDTTAYRQYIKDNIRYPEAAKAAGITGTVILQFSFDKRGKPTNFDLIKSLGYGCDEEAIRLLREGPAWIAPNNSFTTYSIHFNR